MKVRNRVSRKIHTIKRVSQLHGWVQLDESQGWCHLSHYIPVRKKG